MKSMIVAATILVLTVVLVIVSRHAKRNAEGWAKACLVTAELDAAIESNSRNSSGDAAQTTQYLREAKQHLKDAGCYR